jgi:hypothetical protein
MTRLTRPFAHGHTTVGVVRAKAIGKSLPDGNFSGVLIKAPGTEDDAPNTVAIYIGDATVTANLNPDTGGFPLAPGQSITVPLESAEDLYVVATAGSQDMAWWLQ